MFHPLTVPYCHHKNPDQWLLLRHPWHRQVASPFKTIGDIESSGVLKPQSFLLANVRFMSSAHTVLLFSFISETFSTTNKVGRVFSESPSPKPLLSRLLPVFFSTWIWHQKQQGFIWTLSLLRREQGHILEDVRTFDAQRVCEFLETGLLASWGSLCIWYPTRYRKWKIPKGLILNSQPGDQPGKTGLGLGSKATAHSCGILGHARI